MLIQILAGIAVLLVLWTLFRFAMGLRYSKVSREEARLAEEGRGRRVVAEIPLGDDLVLFLEDEAAFYWGGKRVAKGEIVGARMLLGGGIMGTLSRNGALLPDPPQAEAYEGRERWDVLIYARDGHTEAVPCGTLREGVSREIAGRVFEVVRRAALRP